MRNAVEIRYTIDPGSAGHVKLWLMPFAVLRDFHALRRAEGSKLQTLKENDTIIVRDGQKVVTSRQIAVRAGAETRVRLEFPVASVASK